MKIYVLTHSDYGVDGLEGFEHKGTFFSLKEAADSINKDYSLFKETSQGCFLLEEGYKDWMIEESNLHITNKLKRSIKEAIELAWGDASLDGECEFKPNEAVKNIINLLES